MKTTKPRSASKITTFANILLASVQPVRTGLRRVQTFRFGTK